MKRTLIVGAAVALLLSGGGIAAAQTPAPRPLPTCGEALGALGEAQGRFRAAVADDDAYAALKARRDAVATTDAAYLDAQAKYHSAHPAVTDQAVVDADATVAPAKAAYDAAVKANPTDAELAAAKTKADATDATALGTQALAAQRVADDACRPRMVTTTSTPVPVVITIPKAIDTGYAA
jgi:hypothetical protein